MLKLLKSFSQFLFKRENFTFPPITNGKFYLNLFLFKALVFVFVVLIFRILLGYGGSDNAHLLGDKGILKIFLNFIILAPILEEIVFRYHTNMKLRSIVISFVGAIILFYDSVFGLVLIGGYLGILFTFKKSGFHVSQLFLVYTSSIMFGIAHIAFVDYSVFSENFINTTFVITTRFFSGLIACYVFYIKGILASIIFHGVWNLLPFFSLLISTLSL